jgi:hypothetical protein
VSPWVKTAAARGLALALLAAGVAPLAAYAHVAWEPTAVNRYVNLWLAPGKLEYQLALLYGTHPARLERERLDLDRDGTIEPPELEGERRALAGRAPQLLQLRVDGRPVRLAARAEVDLNDDEGVESTPFLTEVSGAVALAPGRHRLEVTVGPDLPRMGETEIVVETEGWTVVASEQPPGRATASPQRHFAFARPRASVDEPRAVVFVVDTRPGGGPARAVPYVVAVVVVVAAAAAVVWRRRRRAG